LTLTDGVTVATSGRPTWHELPAEALREMLATAARAEGRARETRRACAGAGGSVRRPRARARSYCPHAAARAPASDDGDGDPASRRLISPLDLAARAEKAIAQWRQDRRSAVGALW